MTHAGIIATPVAAAGAAITRQHFFVQELGQSQNADATTWTTKATLTFTPDAAHDYALFWCCELGHSADGGFPSSGTEQQLTVGGTSVEACTWQPFGSLDAAVGWASEGGFHVITGAGSPVTVTLDFRRTSDSFPSELGLIRRARIIALRLETGDVHAESLTRQSTTLSSFVDAVTLSFTPSSTGAYLILGGGVLDGFGAHTASFRLFDGSGGTSVWATEFITGVSAPTVSAAWDREGLSGAQSFKLQYASDLTGAEVGVTGARLLALRLDGFTRVLRTALNIDTAGGAAAYAPALTLTRTLQAGDYLTLGAWAEDVTPGGTGAPLQARLNDPTAAVSEIVGRALAGGYILGFAAVLGGYAAGLRSWSIETAGPGGLSPGSLLKAGSSLLAFKLD